MMNLSEQISSLEQRYTLTIMRVAALRRLFIYREVYRSISSPKGDAYGYGEFDKTSNSFEFPLLEDEVKEFNRVVLLEKTNVYPIASGFRPAGYGDETPPEVENARKFEK